MIAEKYAKIFPYNFYAMEYLNATYFKWWLKNRRGCFTVFHIFLAFIEEPVKQPKLTNHWTMNASFKFFFLPILQLKQTIYVKWPIFETKYLAQFSSYNFFLSHWLWWMQIFTKFHKSRLYKSKSLQISQNWLF